MAQLGSVCRGRVAVVAPWLSTLLRDVEDRAGAMGETRRVDYLVEGSVRRDGDRVRITARIVDFASETQLWTDVFERELTGCLSVQAEVAEAAARSLATELSGR